MKTIEVAVYGVPYDIEELRMPTGQTYFTVENFLGLDGVEFLKRKNPFGDASGYVGTVAVDVREDRLDIYLVKDTDALDQIEDAIGYIVESYPSIGWECLDC